MDVLSGIVEAAKARVSIDQAREYRANFSEFFPGRIKNVHFVVSGQCQLMLDDDKEQLPRVLRAGDIVVVAGQSNHHLIGDGLTGSTERIRIASGHLTSQDIGSGAINSFLPPVLVMNLHASSTRDDLEDAVRIGGACDEEAGGRAILSRLTELLVLMTAHRRVAHMSERTHGWVGALLSDPKIGKSLRLIHADPTTHWTVDRLAREVGMSRTAFSQQFSERVGQAPMAYVTRWRMQIAIDMLRVEVATTAEIAAVAGYASESAFSKAFRREIGVPPAAYGKAMAEASRDLEKLKATRLKETRSLSAREDFKVDLEKIALELERLAPPALCSILLYYPAEGKLRLGAAPSLPDAYNKTIDGINVGPSVGSCGTAVFRRQPVVTRDILSSDLWSDFRYLAERYNLRSCWSNPIFGEGNSVLGTFAVYYTDFHEPNGAELGLIDHMSGKVKAVLESIQTGHP